jgi:hypothetical protein
MPGLMWFFTALVRRVRERGKIWSNCVFAPPMEELPNRWHLGDNRPVCSFPRELHPPAMDYLWIHRLFEGRKHWRKAEAITNRLLW